MWTSPAWTPAAADPMGEPPIPCTVKMAESTSQHLCKDTEALYRCLKHNCGADCCIGHYIMSSNHCISEHACPAQDLPDAQLQKFVDPGMQAYGAAPSGGVPGAK